MKRRGFLQFGLLLVAAGLFLTDRLRSMWRGRPLTDNEQETFAAYLDTLLPADETPGALDLGIQTTLFDKAAADEKYRRTIKAGCAWLDRQTRKIGSEGFAALAEEEKRLLVSRSASGEWGSVERRLYDNARNDAFHAYYAHPGSWAGLAYRGPPQPLGYLDYSEPPAEAGSE